MQQTLVELQGKYNTAKVFTDNVDDMTIGQVIELCNQPFVEGSKIRIMPDTHAGKGSVIGTTMTITDKVVPNLVGVDIGCGMNVTKLAIKAKDINFEELDAVINKHVPSGMTARSKAHRNSKAIPFDKVLAPINRDRAEKSIGTLGGGNHFIEVNEDEDGFIYLVIHSGSRNIGKTVAEYYQDVAIKRLSENRKETDVKIEQLKAEGRQAEISEFLKESKKNRPAINKALAYVEGKDMEDYIHDLTIAQQYALVNRNTMAEVILEQMGWDVVEKFDTIHNYIDVENMILRKGAISAQKGEVVIIPMNMRDGSLICVGKGNPDWNFSGPHGAGRLMSRSKAKELINLEEFKETMKDVWSTSVVQSTLDESPFAYKPMDEIIQNVKESVDILKVIKPLYNFKAK
jgi:tRNA-splicing ligase RtcB